MHGAFQLYVNGVSHTVEVAHDKSLLFVLREDLGLTGSKAACGEGECGACTVLVDGRPVRSCVEPVHEVAGRQVLTIEGVAPDGCLHPLQEAFLECGALQCGYCTPGMIMSALGLLVANPSPSHGEIVEWMQGNICRCGAYPRIVRAIRKAAEAHA